MKDFVNTTINRLKRSKQFKKIVDCDDWTEFQTTGNSDTLYSLAHFGVIELLPVRLGIVKARLAK